MLGSMLDQQELAPDTVRRIMRVEFERMVEAGIFDEDERLELLRGEIVAMSRQMGSPHAESVTRLNRMLVQQIGPELDVRPQCPLAAWDDSEPQPDVAVVPRGSFDRHADTCVLVVEVADTSFRKDSTIKASLYAEAGIPVYWLVDVVRGEVLVHSQPRAGTYRRIDRCVPGDVLTLDGHPAIAVPVAEIVPPVV